MDNICKEFDLYEIRRNGIISDFDQKVLTRLYQPIIGHVATSLYLTLLGEFGLDKVVSDNRNHKRLFNILQIEAEEFTCARKKLESIGLLTTYVKEAADNVSLVYLYALNSPKVPEEFFKDVLLSNLLLRSLGEVEYQRTQYFYNDIREFDDNFVNISASFEQNFEVAPQSINNISNHFSKKRTSNINLNFNIDDFLLTTSVYLIPKYVFTEIVKQEITRIKLLFNIPEDKLLEMINQSLAIDDNKKKYLDLKKLETLAQETIDVKKSNSDDFDSKYLDFCKILDEEDSFSYYRGLLAIPALFKEDIRLITNFNSMGIPRGVINGVLYYCVMNKKNNFNFTNYVNKVMSSVVKEKCKNALDTLNYLKSTIKKPRVRQILNDKEETVKEKDLLSAEELANILKMLGD